MINDAWIIDMDRMVTLPTRYVQEDSFDITKIEWDLPNAPIIGVVKALYESGYYIVVISGQSHTYREEIKYRLDEVEVYIDDIFLRAEGDSRLDAEVKQDIYRHMVKPKYNAIGVLSDKRGAVDMWRSFGLTCLQIVGETSDGR